MTSPRFPFALSHPLSVLLDKSPQDFTRADMIRVIEREENRTDHLPLYGARRQTEGAQAPGRRTKPRPKPILAEGERVDGSSLFKGMVETAMSDLYVVPVYSTAFLNPFDDRSLDFICRYFTKDGVPAPFAPDNILNRAAALFRKNTGLELQALGEIEFYLLSDRGPRAFSRPNRRRGITIPPRSSRSGAIVNEILSRITQITGAVKYAHGEVGSVESVRSDRARNQGQAGRAAGSRIPSPARSRRWPTTSSSAGG